MKKALTIGGSLVVGILVLALFTLRLIGFEPAYLDSRSEEFARSGRIANPGLWLTGEVVREEVTNWDFAEQVNDPITRNSIYVETRTWYGIPHSVVIGVWARGDKLYIHAHSDPNRMQIPFPIDKTWTANVARDPRVRLKIAGKLYDMTLVLVTDRAEAAAVMGRDPVTVETGPDGQEHVAEVMHVWRVFQRNIPDYSEDSQGTAF